ncbi:hypothetical protein RYH80_09245 [Halobaculum sp. MBLA0147]|uniref:hypothetical protein n=1 Tax=Halobaculum sp. MBLA0147 TaxID=3079934 RepID=UPI00352380A7
MTIDEVTVGPYADGEILPFDTGVDLPLNIGIVKGGTAVRLSDFEYYFIGLSFDIIETVSHGENKGISAPDMGAYLWFEPDGDVVHIKEPTTKPEREQRETIYDFSHEITVEYDALESAMLDAVVRAVEYDGELRDTNDSHRERLRERVRERDGPFAEAVRQAVDDQYR